MFLLRGYRVEKRLSVRAHAQLYAATRDADGLSVILKAYSAAQGGRSRAEREAEALGQLCGPGIVRLIELDRSSETPVLVLERLAGRSLKSALEEQPLAVASALRIGAQLAESLAGVHAGRFIHCGIHPRSVLVHRETLETHLIDFGLARALGSAQRAHVSAGGTRMEGKLQYMAPEQSGRMGLGVDLRSDLYALGATLYAALVGHPPFRSLDPLELIHSHIALVPPSPRELRAAVPETLSRIVMKLLCKQPDARYQSARALAVDLRLCLTQWEETGSLADQLALGASELPERPVFAARLYGRDAEIEALRAAYARAARGASQLVVLRGGPGVGKSALVASLRGAVNQSGGYLTAGKFDLYRRDRPYVGLTDALDGWLQQVLTESQERLAQFAASLRAELGGIAQVMVDWLPDLSILLGDVAPVPALGPRETQVRLGLALERFLRACAQPQHPLAIVLDDLQWADAGTLALFEQLALQREAALLLIATYRDSEVDAQHPLARLIARLGERNLSIEIVELGPLSLEASGRMLADALQRSELETRELARQVERKTANAALHIQQFIEHLGECGWLRYEVGRGWVWDDALVAAAHIPEDALGLMTARIERIDRETRGVLALASCVGDEFDLELLARLSERARERLESALYALADLGLIQPCARGYRFVHDRIREVAQRQLSDAERVALHHQTALLLLERTPEALLGERIFDIVDHLNRALERLSHPDRLRAIELNLLAGKRALGAGAPESAQAYLASARRLFGEDDWRERAALGFDVLFHAAESAFQNRQFDAALRLLDALESHGLSILQRGYVIAKRAGIHASNGDPQAAVECMLTGLRRLGTRWPLHPSAVRLWWEMLRTDRALRRLGAGAGLEPAALSEAETARLLIVLAALPACNRVNARLATLLAFWRMGSFARRGYLDAPGHALVSYGVHRYWFSADAARTRRHVQMGLELSSAIDPPRLRLQVLFLNHAYVNPWLMPRRAALQPLTALAQQAVESGDLEYEYYCRTVVAYYRAFSGVRVDEAERELRALRGMTMMASAFALLREGACEPGRVESELAAMEAVLPHYRPLAVQTRTFWMILLCALGRYPAAFAQAAELGDAALERYPGLATVVDFCFFRGLAAAVLAAGARGRQRRSYLRTLRGDHRRLRHWARNGPDFVHMAVFLAGERARLRQGHATALSLYEEAARRADAEGYVHQAALAHERRAELLAALGRAKPAAAALRDALRRYRTWGAAAKVRQLQERSESLSESRGSAERN